MSMCCHGCPPGADPLLFISNWQDSEGGQLTGGEVLSLLRWADVISCWLTEQADTSSSPVWVISVLFSIHPFRACMWHAASKPAYLQHGCNSHCLSAMSLLSFSAVLLPILLMVEQQSFLSCSFMGNSASVWLVLGIYLVPDTLFSLIQ